MLVLVNFQDKLVQYKLLDYILNSISKIVLESIICQVYPSGKHISIVILLINI